MRGRDDKIPEIQERWKRLHQKKVPMQKYVLGAIVKELHKMKSENDNTKPELRYATSLECWKLKKKKKQECKIRLSGEPGKKKKCQICFEELPIDMLGV